MQQKGLKIFFVKIRCCIRDIFPMLSVLGKKRIKKCMIKETKKPGNIFWGKLLSVTKFRNRKSDICFMTINKVWNVVYQFIVLDVRLFVTRMSFCIFSEWEKLDIPALHYRPPNELHCTVSPQKVYQRLKISKVAF